MAECREGEMMPCLQHPNWVHGSEDCPFCVTSSVIRLDPKNLHCMTCGKQVSTAYFPIENEIDRNDIVIRAYIECPECIEKKHDYSRSNP